MNPAIAITENSFIISGRGLILELRHEEEGLPEGTELISDKSGHIWRVNARVLFDHAIDYQKVFESESAEFMLMRFESPEKLKKSIEGIKEREEQNIYQYLLKPIGHEHKPLEGEKLRIEYPR